MVLVELKTVTDALTSFTDPRERLKSQMWRCYQNSDIAMLIVCGYLAPTSAGWCATTPLKKDESNGLIVHVLYNAWRNYLARLNQFGIITDEVSRQSFLPKRIEALYWWTQKGSQESLMPGLATPKVTSGGDFVKLRKLMLTDGWGEELASRMLEHYGSPWEALKALLEGEPKAILKEIKGMGVGPKKLARLREEWALEMYRP